MWVMIRVRIRIEARVGVSIICITSTEKYQKSTEKWEDSVVAIRKGKSR